MHVMFVTREPEVCQLIAARLSDAETKCTVYNDFLQFYLALQEETIQCDLLVLDFRQFQHMLCNVSDVFRRLKRPIPFIFYNDPYPDSSNRVMYWMQQNESLYENMEFHTFVPFFKTLNDIIEDPLVRPHISLLQPPVPVTFVAKNTSSSEIDLVQFRVRSKMPPSLFSLFEFFYQNMCKEVSVKDISRQIFGSGFRSDVKRNCVYSYVSRLKKYIKSDCQIHLDIIRSSQERYKMVLGM